MRYPWMADARCAYLGDPEMFFPAQGDSIKEVREFCMGCPVRTECREFAVDRPYLYGIWGGLTRNERAEIRRVRRGSAPHSRPGRQDEAAFPFA